MDTKSLDKYLDNLKNAGIPSCELIVTHKGETVYHKCAGYADAEGTKPTSERDVYWLFSATKVITCIAAMRLVERGIIALDDPVSKYIPEYKDVKVLDENGSAHPAKEPMRVVHLFNMTGGMTYDRDMDAIGKCPDKSTLGILRSFASVPLVFEPGTRYRYSLCHDVLAGVVEQASGMSFGEYLKKNIFEPLKIADMGFFPTEEQKARFSEMYSYNNSTGVSVKRENQNGFILTDEYESGGAGLFGTASDYIKIVNALSLGGTAPNGYCLLTEKSVKMMQENYLCQSALVDFAVPPRLGYGWGLCGRVHMNPALSQGLSPVGEFGWDGAAGAYTLIDPENQISLFYAQHIFGCNFAYHKIHPTLRDLTYQMISSIDQ